LGYVPRFKLLTNLQKTIDTLEEKRAEQRTKAEERKLKKEQTRQAQLYAKLIPQILADEKLATVITETNKQGRSRRRVKKVRIVPPVLIHKDYYMLEVDTLRRPTGVNTTKLRQPEVIEQLSHGLGTQVEVVASPTQGFWYVVARRGGLGIIPKEINYHDALALLPQSAGRWGVVIGAIANKKIVWLDVRDHQHFYIAGSTGSGKSVYIKNFILTLAAKNSPAKVRFILCDFKGRSDLIAIKNLPHIGSLKPIRLIKKDEITFDDENGQISHETEEDYGRGLITNPADLPHILKWADKEAQRREDIFSQISEEGVPITNINQYNRHFRRSQMERIFLIMDEYPVAVDEHGPKIREEIHTLTSAIVRKGRSAGIHIVLGSQVGSASVVPGKISQNINTRLVGFSTGPQSQTLLGHWGAHRIDKKGGRFFYQNGLNEEVVQTPWVSPRLAVKLVKEISQRWSQQKEDEDEVATRLFEYALTSCNGLYDAETIYQQLEDDEITREVAREIGQEYQLTETETGQRPEIPIKGEIYYLLPAVPGKRPRKLIEKETYLKSQTQTRPVASSLETTGPIPDPEPEPEEIMVEEASPTTDPETENQADLAQTLFAYSLRHFNGNFAEREIVHSYPHALSRDQFREIARTYEGQPITVNGDKYILEPGRGSVSRHLKRIKETETNDQ
jgi:hypothetical protein